MSDGHWQLEGTGAAELFERYLVPAITAKWAEDLLDRAQPREGEAVLDIACGTGVVARLAAKRMGRGRVTGLDLNAGMLAVARNAPTEGAAIIWIEGGALDLPFPADSFDVVFCQLGLQFFPDQRKALGKMRRVLKGGGRAALSVFSGIERTPGANAFVLALDDVIGGDASRIKRGEHSFTDATQLETLLRDSGFNAVDVQAVEQTIVFPSVLDYERFSAARDSDDRPAEGPDRARTRSDHFVDHVQDHSVIQAGDAGRRQVHLPTGGVCRDCAQPSLTVSAVPPADIGREISDVG
jgi:ubiquinone/menaquinone biosynthesis C-methylase UbiE